MEQIFANTLFIGGSPCSGKSTIAAALAERYNFAYYKIDDYEGEHINRSDSRQHTIMHKWKNPVWDDIWMRPPDIQVSEELQFYEERFSMILEDLHQFSEKDQIITEGAALLPDLMYKANVSVDRAIYLIPTKEFQVEYYSKRSFIKGILSQCSNPEKAFFNWMERDYRFGKKIALQAKSLGYEVILVDGEKTIDENYELVCKHFGLA